MGKILDANLDSDGNLHIAAADSSTDNTYAGEVVLYQWDLEYPELPLTEPMSSVVPVGDSSTICLLESSQESITPLNDVGIPYGIAVDKSSQMLYWINHTGMKIQRSNTDGTNLEDLVTTGLSSLVGIDVDHSGEKVYWADSGTQKIQRANLDGSSVQDLVTGLIGLADIAVDSLGGKIYWADKVARKIQRANLDGTAVEDLITFTGFWSTNSISLDTLAGKIYWEESFSETINRSNLDGTEQEVVVTEPNSTIRGIEFDSIFRKLYWIDQASSEIKRYDARTLATETVVPSLPGLSYKITVDGENRKIYFVDINSTDGDTQTGGEDIFCLSLPRTFDEEYRLQPSTPIWYPTPEPKTGFAYGAATKIVPHGNDSYTLIGAPGAAPEVKGSIYIFKSSSSGFGEEIVVGPGGTEAPEATPSNYVGVDLPGEDWGYALFGKSIATANSSTGFYFAASAPGLQSLAGQIFLFHSSSAGITLVDDSDVHLLE
jgi:DNA-binding beta-propeller fold protein YncE